MFSFTTAILKMLKKKIPRHNPSKKYIELIWSK